MSYMVVFQNAEGRTGYHQADGLEEATRFVEHLRNREEVDRARMFQMVEVRFEFRPYFKVELSPGAGGSDDEVISLTDAESGHGSAGARMSASPFAPPPGAKRAIQDAQKKGLFR